VPVAATAAEYVPAATSADCSSGFARFVKSGEPFASTSTAGAAAVCRTVSRASPASTVDVSLTNTVSVGLPLSSRCATIEAFVSSATVALPDRAGFAVDGSPAARMSIL
jgi:hypothetical protein